MKYTYQQRLEIGRQIYFNEVSRFKATEKYGISADSARDYMRLYRDMCSLPAKNRSIMGLVSDSAAQEWGEYSQKTRAELIAEIIRLRTRLDEQQKIS